MDAVVDAMVRWMLSAVRGIIGAVLVASMVLICANAFGRYVLLKPIVWAEEVLGYALVWMVYLGAILVTWNRDHLRMDLLSRSLTGWPRRIVDLLTGLAFVAAGGLIIWQSFTAIASFTHTSLVAGLPMDIVHAVIPVSFALMILCVLARLGGAGARNGEAPKEPAP